ncbi:MAG: DNA alkylation repair protein [Anaerolineales bacterium]|nr:DNA alkylation repair protein [Anaerolineales bacterium]
MPEPLKNMFNARTVDALAQATQQEYPPFDRERFTAHVFDAEWEGRELKQRIRHLATLLGEFLPAEYPAALAILRRVVVHLTEQGFEKMVFPDFVEVYGVDDWETSIPALEYFTQFMSAEFAIRPFLLRDLDRTMAQMLAWAHHPHEDVRRLATEGCRPRLPWGMAIPALKADPARILPILEILKDDPSETVRRSVANNLNDISKDHPALVVSTLQRWQTDREEIRALTRHALRTLIKQGDPGALALLGHADEVAVAVQNLRVSPVQVPLEGKVTFSFEIVSLANVAQDLIIDYVVYLQRANGKQTPKVFKLSKRTLQPGETIQFTRTHSFRPITTRRYYPGPHAIEPQVNGKTFGRVEFALIAQD